MTTLRAETDAGDVTMIVERDETVTRFTLDPAEARTLADSLTASIRRAEAARLALALL